MLYPLRFFLLAFLGTLIAPALAEAPAITLTPDAAYTRLAFTARDGVPLSYVRYPEASPSPHPVVISVGCGETAYRYEALVDDLRARGYGPIYILEHRGQGYSGGAGIRSDLVHINHFDDYVTDFGDFVRGPVAYDLRARGITTAPDVIAHSMGGAIANLALAVEPNLARKVVYVSPMMDINTAILNPMNDRLALWAAEALCATGFCESIGVGQLGRKRRLKIPGVPQEIREGIFRGGVTPGWLKESILATRRIRKQAYLHTESTLMVVALRDRLVGNPALRTYASRAKNCSLIEIDGPHGLHHDVRSRRQLVTAIDDFFRDCQTRLEP